MSGWSLVFQIVNFAVLALLLRRFLFKPVGAMIARRQDELARTKAEGERAQRDAEALRKAVETEREGMDAGRAQRVSQARAEAETEREKILSEARAEAATIVAAARSEVEAERVAAADAASAEAVKLATSLARRLLGEVSTSAVTEALLERLCAHLDALSSERKRALRDELQSGELLVATAPALEAGVRDRWKDRIAERFGGRPIRFVGDDALVAGAELRFPHTTLSFTWRDGLNAAAKELLHHGDDR